MNLSLYTKVATLQSGTQSLLEKVNQLEKESNVKIANLVRKTESCTVSIKRFKRNEERMTVASKMFKSELILLVGSIKNDFETKMKEGLSKKKSELDSAVKKLETVITDQDIIIGTMKEEMNTVKRSIEQCLPLKDDLNGNAERLRNVNMQMEKFNKDSSFLQQENNRFSQKIHDNYKELIQLKNFTQSYVFDNNANVNSSFQMIKKDVKTIYQNVSTINARLSTECMMSANLKVLVETVQQKEIKEIGVKLDKTDQSVGSVLKEVKTHGEEITKIPDRLHTLNKTTEILSIGKYRNSQLHVCLNSPNILFI